MHIMEKLAHDVNVRATGKIALSGREKALLATLGLTGLAIPTIASTARNAGTITGLSPVAPSVRDNVLGQTTFANTKADEYNNDLQRDQNRNKTLLDVLDPRPAVDFRRRNKQLSRLMNAVR